MPNTIVVNTPEQLRELVSEAIHRFGPECDLNHLDISRMETLEGLFRGTPFNGDVSLWDTSQVTNMNSLFKNCPFNGDLSKWNVSQVQHTSSMFELGSFSGELSDWRLPKLLRAEQMFDSCPFNGDVTHLGASNLSTAYRMFHTPFFQGDLSLWTLHDYCIEADIFHPQFMGFMPVLKVDAHNSCERYATMIGGHAHLGQYAQRAPFGFVHADLLLRAPAKCSWASQEVVRWAEEVGEMGRTLGLNAEALRRILVDNYQQQGKSMPVIVGGELFGVDV